MEQHYSMAYKKYSQTILTWHGEICVRTVKCSLDNVKIKEKFKRNFYSKFGKTKTKEINFFYSPE